MVFAIKNFSSIFYQFCFSAPRFWEKMNHFSLKMHQIWHMSFCMTILRRKLTKIFLLKTVLQKLMYQIWCIFKEKWLIFSSKPRHWKAKVSSSVQFSSETVNIEMYDYIRNTRILFYINKVLWFYETF